LVTACGGENRPAISEDSSDAESKEALVVTSNYPLYFFASRIADGVEGAPDILFPEIEGDPASWVPSAEQIQLLQSADVVLLNGAGAEPWLDLITIDRRSLIDTSENIADLLIPIEDSIQHQHGPDGDHSHQDTAFTTWLDPQLAIVQAQSVTNALVQLAPSGDMGFRDNMAKLEKELMQLDSRLAEVFEQLNDRPVLFSHPVYQYLQRRYDINGHSVHWEPEQQPTTAAWIAMQQVMATHPATIMIWEDEPVTSTVQRLSDAGVISVHFHTAANKSEQGDYLSMMRENANRLESAL
jgi:zinc transport system substrate-binding protein